MKRIQFTTRYKGGGGTTVQNIPKEFRPYITGVMDEAKGAYESGDLGKVAGTSELQGDAFGMGADAIKSAMTGGASALGESSARLGEMAKTGTGFTGGEALKLGASEEAGKKIAGMSSQFGQAGTLGSARQMGANAGVQNELAAKFAGIDYDIAKEDVKTKLAAEQGIGSAATTGANIATSGASSLSTLGGQQRGIDQQQLDADYQALSRYAGMIYGNPSRQQATSGGGGK